MGPAERSWKCIPMKPNPTDQIADREAEERSENEGMPEHRAKAHDPVRWAADRDLRMGHRMPERSPSRGGMFGVALMCCAMLAAVGSARGALRWMRRGGGMARLPR
ncbi:hypothetical protein [Siccirubricoccus sp. G192]|uniref:hypothetical protein n=1 Tax=Siccirubricoccus sp. G192 TaxID=2849651 RepID=UPI001C2BD1B7|nr:hypothetical protein [Siccirubricoccus sp. G192]MBV1800373.1 hypothetical protein [Siccirubricoccus sp. G192]